MIDTGLGVKALILNGHEVLILVKPNGVSDLPGGKVEYGENQKEALDREIAEETGLITRIHDPIANWSFIKSDGLQITGVTYLCQYLGGIVTLSDEHCNYFWLRQKNIECFNSHSVWVNASKLNNKGFAKFQFSIKSVKFQIAKSLFSRSQPISGTTWGWNFPLSAAAARLNIRIWKNDNFFYGLRICL